MKVIKGKATGVLGLLLADIDERELARTRKRMMLAVKIEEAMKNCGLNKKQFADLMKKSPTVISEWLSGDRNFTIDTLTDIEEALGIHLLNVTLMTVVAAGTSSSITISPKQQFESTMKEQGEWNTSNIMWNSTCQRKLA